MITLRRRLAVMCCGLVERVLPSSLSIWADAIRIEVAQIDDDTQALFFALDSLLDFARRGLSFLLLRLSGSIAGPEALSPGGQSTMSYLDDWQATPRAVGVACAIGATLLGIAFMVMGGAPISYLGINLGALVIGLLLFANLSHTDSLAWRKHDAMIAVAGLALLATALLGVRVGDIARWVKIGPLFVQPSLVLLPMMIVASVRARSATATCGMIAAAVALALQPDRAMAGALAAGAVALLASRRDAMTIATAIASLAGFAVTMVRPDAGEAMPFVDQIIYRSFDVHILAGSAVIGGLALLLLPSFVGARHGQELRAASYVFGTTWAAIIVAAALGNYPTPVVGYSGGAVLGYVLSLAVLPRTIALIELRGERASRDAAIELQSNSALMLGSTGMAPRAA